MYLKCDFSEWPKNAANRSLQFSPGSEFNHSCGSTGLWKYAHGPDQTLSATFPEKPAYYPDLFTDGRRHRNCCRFFNYTSMQLRGCEFITEEEKKAPRGWKGTSVRENSMENVTLYYRNLLLWKWWNVSSSLLYANGYRTTRGIAIHSWASDSA